MKNCRMITSISSTSVWFRTYLLFIFVLQVQLKRSHGMKIRRPWTTKHWCQSVINPEWPFAYSKYKEQVEEIKGRVSSNKQDVRHVCETKGVQSKCHICEDIQCGENLDHQCHFQLQGVAWEKMSKNIPTVSDIPWAVGGAHRYDFGGGNTTHVCMYMSGILPCQSNYGVDYSRCTIRCWGYGSGLSGLNNTAGPTSNVMGTGSEGQQQSNAQYGTWPNSKLGFKLNGLNATPWLLPQPTATWRYPKSDYNSGKNAFISPKTSFRLNILPQGFTFTLAGSINGEGGFKDGLGPQARFRQPEGLAVDHDGYVYVADTGNHAIRMISPSGKVSTIAGTGEAGFFDGYVKEGVTFSSPSGVTVWRDWRDNRDGRIVLFVADTGNHRIRKISGNVMIEKETGEKSMINVTVECFSGNCDKHPQAGFSDGDKTQCRFDSPIGIIASSRGDIFITDTNNHLIRMVDLFGSAITLAGKKVLSEVNRSGKRLEGCPDPCLTGAQGHEDGDLQKAKFTFPTGVALMPDESSLLVTNRHFLRRVDLKKKLVKTVAGGNGESERDGQGLQASFNKPNDVSITSDGFVYLVDSTSCRIKRAVEPRYFVPTISCSDTVSNVFRPSGCSSYDAKIDEHGFKVTSQSGNTFYNFRYRNFTDVDIGEDFIGRGIKDCVGSPPRNELDKLRWNESTLVIDDNNTNVREDPNEGSLLIVACLPNCNNTDVIYGVKFFSGDNAKNQTVHYNDNSSICIAAKHAGLLLEHDENPVLINVILQRSMSVFNESIYFYYSRIDGEKRVYSFPETNQYFSLTAASNDMIVQTISGPPTTLRGESCGYGDSFPAQDAKFDIPTAIAAFVNDTLDDKSRFLFVADKNNNAVRGISAVCTFPCENGGRCIGPDQCECPHGWGNIDCSTPLCSDACENRQLCVAPNTCACIPGYEGVDCSQATCVQQCEHGGICVAPDTCSCAPGWFDANCTTPVCQQTCGNGGNCTAPNHCSCPKDWTGPDCRIPVCNQSCENSGWCVAPNTCLCPPDWSGYDCSEPVCHQGFFEPYDNGNKNDAPMHWLQYQPCDLESWCDHTNSFDCSQELRDMKLMLPLFGDRWRHQTGFKDKPGDCFLIELEDDAISSFQYIKSWDNQLTPFQRYTNFTPNDWRSKEPLSWNAHVSPEEGYSGPWDYAIDRQVALVEFLNVTQGSYKCANGGKCIQPDTCACADGWIGFDCRVPVCVQGYFEPFQTAFVKGRNNENELDIFGDFLDRKRPYHLNSSGTGYSNPYYLTLRERFRNSSFIHREEIKNGGELYLKIGGETQGGYECSIRSVSEWEDYRTGFMFEHPNYFSRYMDRKVEHDGIEYTHWEEMGWESVFEKTQLLEISESMLGISNKSESHYVYTDKGYLKLGHWRRTNSSWSKGSCIIEFKRVCDGDKEMYDLESNYEIYGDHMVQDTDLSFRPRIQYDNDKVIMMGEWRENSGQCIDHVVRGCYNNGTCIGPNKCECSEGWSGEDCSVPSCQQECKHNGNCTLPNICTCERGWTGIDCSIALCAQNCNNGGQCVAPDTCKCRQWENEWRDGRAHGGVPLFQTEAGDPQLTGWTGYDCSTPICVQAEKFILNVNKKAYKWSDLISLGGHGKDGKLECEKVECPEYNNMVTMNDGESFQSGCGFDPIDTGCCLEVEGQGITSSFICFKCDPDDIITTLDSLTCPMEKIKKFQYDSYEDVDATFKHKRTKELYRCGPNHNPILNKDSNYTSPRFLCERHEWEQGDYADDIGRHIRINNKKYIRDPNDPYNWTEGYMTPGEGVFACYNGGSCIAPDTCTCKDGYTGFDCKMPICRHEQVDGTIVGCLNGGFCEAKDKCICPKIDSVLWLEQKSAGKGMTGWGGSDCSMPICVQGYFDPECGDNPFAIGGEGCYRCANEGLCIAPDECQCADGWTGYDCKTPICRMIATPLIRKQLMTVDERKIAIFESDPCGMIGFYEGNSMLNDVYRGICALPNQCTCDCKGSYDKELCQLFGGKHCRTPFQDSLHQFRNVLAPNQVFGTRSCYSGFEGSVDDNDKFMSCHMNIYEPTYIIENSISLLFWCTLAFVGGVIAIIYIRISRHRKFSAEQIESRKLRRGAMIHRNSHAFSFTSAETSKKEK